MAEDVYAVPDLTKKVRYRREREQETEDRGEREERVVDIYVSADDLGRGPDPGPGTQQNAAQAQHGAPDESRKKNAFKAATVCLGVLCVILLAGITGLGVRKSGLVKELDHLQFRYNNVTAERDELKRRLCGPGWQGFGRGCYYISTEEKTWEESRQYCRDNQSYLIIINSKEEQDFVKTVVYNWIRYHGVWLGLTDIEKEGEWKWVDGTPLTPKTRYWYPGEPNDYGVEDCAVHLSGFGWYDESCNRMYRWMCEKAL